MFVHHIYGYRLWSISKNNNRICQTMMMERTTRICECIRFCCFFKGNWLEILLLLNLFVASTAAMIVFPMIMTMDRWRHKIGVTYSYLIKIQYFGKNWQWEYFFDRCMYELKIVIKLIVTECVGHNFFFN